MSRDIQSGISDMRKPQPTKYIQHHKDGSIWARGQTIDGVATGYWEWFRKDGVRMRSGYFEAGAQVGEWTTYDKKGDVYKVTTMKPKAAAKKTRAKK
jgi:antitoxin component YwqK of YwqJK toxin-antitoxin module